MENAPLNKAHQLERRAETLLLQKKFDECIQCHKQAILLFSECYKLTKNPIALESVRLQKEWCERQIETLQLKKTYFERLEEDKVKGITINGLINMENLESKIFRTIETHDSLICYLVQKGRDETDASNCCTEEESPQIKGNKHPKSEATVIEELKLLSGQLKESVQILLVQLDDRNKEIERLKEKIRVLESEQQHKESRNDANLTITDSSGGTSPFVFSPCSDISLDIHNLRSLPPLELLEIPKTLQNN